MKTRRRDRHVLETNKTYLNIFLFDRRNEKSLKKKAVPKFHFFDRKCHF